MPSLWMIVASLLFASMGVCVKLGAAMFSTGEMIFYRGVIAMILISAIAGVAGIPLRTSAWRLQLTRALVGSVALVCYFYAIGQLPLATAVTLNYTAPLFLALLLALWFRERMSPATLACVLVSFVGVILLLKPTLQPDQWVGAAAGLASGMLASIAYLSVRELGRAGEPEVRTVFWFSAVTTVLGLPSMLESRPGDIDLYGALILLGVGVFAATAQMAMTRSYRYGKTMVSANLAYSTVVFSSVFGMLLWSETLSLTAWAGIFLIIGGGVAVGFSMRRSAPSTGSDGAGPGRSN